MRDPVSSRLYLLFEAYLVSTGSDCSRRSPEEATEQESRYAERNKDEQFKISRKNKKKTIRIQQQNVRKYRANMKQP